MAAAMEMDMEQVMAVHMELDMEVHMVTVMAVDMEALMGVQAMVMDQDTTDMTPMAVITNRVTA